MSTLPALGAAAACALLLGCSGKAPALTVTIVLELHPSADRPEHVALSWLDATGFRFEDRRVPSVGSLPGEGLRLATVIVDVSPDVSGPRRIIARGRRGSETVCEGTAVAEPSTQRQVVVTLESGARPDSDGDGVPDDVDNCPTVPNPRQQPCGVGVSPPAGERDGGPPGDARPPTSTDGPTSGISRDMPVIADVPDSSSADVSGASVDVAAPTADAAPPTDAVPSIPAPCPATLFWEADFGGDPTALDVNGDGVKDWALRSGAAFVPQELVSGVWQAPPTRTLDTRPLNPFSQRTQASVRMRHTGLATDPGWGAVFWMNLDTTAPAFTLVTVHLKRQATGGQRLTLYGKESQLGALAMWDGLPDAMIDIDLDVHVPGRRVRIWINRQYRGEYALPNVTTPTTDRYATLQAHSTPAAFDSVVIRLCR